MNYASLPSWRQAIRGRFLGIYDQEYVFRLRPQSGGVVDRRWKEEDFPQLGEIQFQPHEEVFFWNTPEQVLLPARMVPLDGAMLVPFNPELAARAMEIPSPPTYATWAEQVVLAASGSQQDAEYVKRSLEHTETGEGSSYEPLSNEHFQAICRGDCPGLTDEQIVDLIAEDVHSGEEICATDFLEWVSILIGFRRPKEVA